MSMSEAYRTARINVRDLTAQLSKEDLARKVPACPEWTVKELVAHLTGVAADTLEGNLGDVGGPGWTQTQVEIRRDRSLPDLFEEWDDIAVRLESALDELHPTAASMMISDVVTHEHDLRGALGNNDGRDGDGIVIAAAFYARSFGKRLKDAGLPTVIVQGGEHEWVAGREKPQGYVRASLFDMLRGLTGRRTLDEVKGFDWTIDAAPYLELFTMYPVTQKSLNE